MGGRLGVLHVVLVTRQRMNEHTPQAGTVIQPAMNSTQQKEKFHYCTCIFIIYAHMTKTLCIYLKTQRQHRFAEWQGTGATLAVAHWLQFVDDGFLIITLLCWFFFSNDTGELHVISLRKEEYKGEAKPAPTSPTQLLLFVDLVQILVSITRHKQQMMYKFRLLLF